MKKGDKEKISLERVLSCKTITGLYARNILKLLSNNTSVDSDGECPDIIIQTETHTIGVEHCQVDVLFKPVKDKAQSMVETHNRKRELLVKKYSDGSSNLEKDIENGEAIKPILDIIEDMYEHNEDFSYVNFINNFNRVCIKHNNNVQKYMERLNGLSAGKQELMICLIDIPYPKVKNYIIVDNKAERNQSIIGIPITNGILRIIERMNRFDSVIISMYPLSGSQKKKNNVCYYFDPQNINDSVRQQHIKPIDFFALPHSFGLPYKTNVKFPMEKYVKGKDSITITAEISAK